ncbi:serine/threonine-protein kinase [Oceanicella sp. SM1341]|uniref:serine/threonine-protein kinase n=1 Tax=Oceanicella sp. SM1341 TaxID=1548889 RepID=UPI000E4918FE|nr:serine/threonine-protein kinase [Oceanicella sp. SM1341]
MTDETVIVPGGPRRIGKYRVNGVLGQGAMGVVYDGHDPDIDRHVAIKTVHRHLVAASGGEDWLARFAREARAAGRALHPNLVTIFDYLQEDGVPYLVMEKLRSITLEDRMAASPGLELHEIHAIARQVLAGLGCIHKAGIVHRDLKPANVMLTEEGVVKLTDFGIARLTAMEATGAGMVGTPSYMAPEQFSGGEVDARADIYACGVLLYELVTGAKPFRGGGVEALFTAVRQGGVSPPSELSPRAGAALDAAILKAMAVEPGARFASAAELAEALAAALPEADATGLGEGFAVPARPAAPAAGSATMLGRLSSQTMLEVERQLIARMGPMGRIIARRAAASSANAEEMVVAVMGELSLAGEEQGMRESILRLLAASAGPAAADIPDDNLARLAALLRPHLGPIAQVLVKRRAAKAASRAELVEALATDIPDPAARAEFLSAAGTAP